MTVYRNPFTRCKCRFQHRERICTVVCFHFPGEVNICNIKSFTFSTTNLTNAFDGLDGLENTIHETLLLVTFAKTRSVTWMSTFDLRCWRKLEPRLPNPTVEFYRTLVRSDRRPCPTLGSAQSLFESSALFHGSQGCSTPSGSAAGAVLRSDRLLPQTRPHRDRQSWTQRLVGRTLSGSLPSAHLVPGTRALYLDPHA